MKALLLLLGLALIQIPIGMAYAESFQTVYVEENNQVHAIGDLPDDTNAIWLLGPIQGGVHESYYFEDRAWLSGVNMSSHDSIPDGWGGYSSSAQLPNGIYEWVATSNSLTNGKPTISNILEFSTSVTVVASSQTTPEPVPTINSKRDQYFLEANDSVIINVTGANAGETGNFIWKSPNGNIVNQRTYVVFDDGHVTTNWSGADKLGTWTVFWVQDGESISTTFEMITLAAEPTPEPPEITDSTPMPEPQIISEPTPQPSKMIVCHNGHEILVKDNAVRSHVAHGDAVGNCPYEEPEPVQIQVPEPEEEPIPQITNWEQKYNEAISMLNITADKLGEVQQENKTLKDKIDNLNQLVLEQAKLIYKWVLTQ